MLLKQLLIHLNLNCEFCIFSVKKSESIGLEVISTKDKSRNQQNTSGKVSAFAEYIFYINISSQSACEQLE